MTDLLFHSGQHYQQFRPHYPTSLFTWLHQQCTQHDIALDLGCGSGQACRGLEPHFSRVYGADISLSQLQAAPASRSYYLACQAHQLPFPEHSLDLITVAQAFHWFRQDAFLQEAERTLKNHGVLALVSYGLCQVEGLAGLIEEFHDETLAPWWPDERAQVIAGYPQVRLPWPRLAFPETRIDYPWDAQQMLGYLGTWSALVRAREAGQQPLEVFAPRLQQAWGLGLRRVSWPLRVRAWVRSS